MDIFDVEWECKKCLTVNCDSFMATACPCCSDCEAEYQWDDLISDRQMADLNKMRDEVLETEGQAAERELKARLDAELARARNWALEPVGDFTLLGSMVIWLNYGAEGVRLGDWYGLGKATARILVTETGRISSRYQVSPAFILDHAREIALNWQMKMNGGFGHPFPPIGGADMELFKQGLIDAARRLSDTLKQP